MTSTAPHGPFSYFADGMLIEHRLTGARSAAAEHVGIAFDYDAGNPCAVTLAVYQDGPSRDPRSWVFAREMLDHGRCAPAGHREGDVEIGPRAGQWIEFTLRDRDAGETVVLSVDRVAVEAALDAFEHIVPLAAEEFLRPDAAEFEAGLAGLLDTGGDR